MAGICRLLTRNLPKNVNVVTEASFPNHVRLKSAAATAKLSEETKVKVMVGGDHVPDHVDHVQKKEDVNIHDVQQLGGHGQPNNIHLEFMDAKEAYRSKTTWEIFRALFVLKMCQFDALVTYNKEVRFDMKFIVV